MYCRRRTADTLRSFYNYNIESFVPYIIKTSGKMCARAKRVL